MRWNPDRSLPKWAEVSLVVALAPVIVPIAAGVIGLWWLENAIRKGKRFLMGPQVGRWQRWFAWHPVRLDNGWGDSVWLEVVERQALGSSYDYAITYRPTQHNGEQGS